MRTITTIIAVLLLSACATTTDEYRTNSFKPRPSSCPEGYIEMQDGRIAPRIWCEPEENVIRAREEAYGYEEYGEDY